MDQPVQQAPNLKSYRSFGYLINFAIFVSLGYVNYGIIAAEFNSALSQAILSLSWPTEEIAIRESLTNSVITLGSVISIFISGVYMAKFSRRKQLIWADVMTIFGSLLTIISYFPVFMLGRTLQGLSIGVSMLVGPIYIRELAPPEITGKLGSVSKIGYATGLVIAFAMAFALPVLPDIDDHNWIVLFLMPCVISLCRLMFFLFFFKFDSPKYFLLNGKPEEAKKVIQKIYIEICQDEVLQCITNEQKNQKTMGFKKFWRQYKSQAQLAIMLNVFFFMFGTDVINAYSTILLEGGESSTDPVKINEIRVSNTLIGFCRMAGALAGGALLDKLGRRKLYVYGSALLTFAITSLYIGVTQNMILFTEIGVWSFSFSIGLSYGVINPVYLAEILPPIGVSLMLFINQMGTVIILFVFPLVINIPSIGMGGAMICFFVFAATSIPYVYYRVKETKALTMDEIYNLFVLGRSLKVGLLSLSGEYDQLKVPKKGGGFYEKNLGLLANAENPTKDITMVQEQDDEEDEDE